MLAGYAAIRIAFFGEMLRRYDGWLALLAALTTVGASALALTTRVLYSRAPTTPARTPSAMLAAQTIALLFSTTKLTMSHRPKPMVSTPLM